LALTVLAAVSAVASPSVQAATRSKGTMSVYDTPDCTGNGNSPKVTVPFSVGGRNYPPNIEIDVYATDMKTNERFGPFVVTTNASGDFCALVRRARPTQWKIDLVEPGAGSTDSKVITVLPPPTPPTTHPPATTTPPTVAPPSTAPPTLPATTTTVGGSTTTNQGGTTTTAPAATSTTLGATTSTAAGTTTTAVGAEGPPIEIEQVPVPPDSALPGTGGWSATPALWGALFLLLGGVLLAAARGRRSTPR
jgi:hypothetical protein